MQMLLKWRDLSSIWSLYVYDYLQLRKKEAKGIMVKNITLRQVWMEKFLSRIEWTTFTILNNLGGVHFEGSGGKWGEVALPLTSPLPSTSPEMDTSLLITTFHSLCFFLFLLHAFLHFMYCSMVPCWLLSGFSMELYLHLFLCCGPLCFYACLHYVLHLHFMHVSFKYLWACLWCMYN